MQTRAVGAEVQTVSATGGAVRQALANNLQPFAIFFQINAGEVRGFRTFVAVNLFVGLFGAPDHHLLIVNAHPVELLQVVLPTLHKHIAAARIHAVFDNRHFATRLFTRRVFCTVNKAAQVTLFHPTEAVDLFFHFNAVTKGFHRRLSDREVYVVTQRKNVDQHIELGRRRKAFTVARKIFQLFCPNAAAQSAPGVVTKGNHRTKMRVREFRFKSCQFVGKCFTGRTQGVNFPFHVGFDPNRRAAMFWQNATLNLRHCSS